MMEKVRPQKDWVYLRLRAYGMDIYSEWERPDGEIVIIPLENKGNKDEGSSAGHLGRV